MTENEKILKHLVERHLAECRHNLKRFENEAKNPNNPKRERSAVMADAWLLFEADLMVLRLEVMHVLNV